MPKKLLVLGAGNLQIPLINKAKSKGLYTIAVDMNEDAPGKGIADEFYPISTNDSLQLLKLAREHKINGVITNSDYPMRTASYIAAELGLVGMSQTAATIATNKLLLREVLSENNIASPKFAKVGKLEDIYYHVVDLEYPFILKPVDSSASRGVHLIESGEQIESAYNQACENSKNGYLIMEQYIHGDEYSVESLTVNGITQTIAITAKMTTGAPHYVELGHIISADLDHEMQKKVEKLVSNAVLALGISNGVSHTELKINSQGIFIIEIGPRLGGDYITTDLVPLATGYDMVGNAINLAMGLAIDSYKNKQKYAGIAYFIAPEGELCGINGLDIIEASSFVQRYELFIKSGDHVNPLRSSLDRAGYCIMKADSFDECVKELEHLRKSVIFEMA